MTSEKELQIQVADFLRLQYPDVLFHSDYGSGVKLTPAQAAIQKRQNGGRRAWPDLMIARQSELPVQYFLSSEHPRNPIPITRPEVDEEHCDSLCNFPALFIELKKDGTRLKKKNGEWASEHIAEQAEVLERLRNEGYCAEFAVGYDEAVKIIKSYLGEPGRKEVEF